MYGGGALYLYRDTQMIHLRALDKNNDKWDPQLFIWVPHKYVGAPSYVGTPNYLSGAPDK